ncbi:MAG: asparagine synthase-related protein [Lentilitoribacter sp.]
MQTHPLWRRVFEWHSPAYSSLPMKVRFPFFDIRLIEYGQTIPPYPWLHRKFLLREIMKGQLPNEILVRSKTALPGNPMLANIEEYGEPDWQRSIPDPDHIGDFIDLNLFLENALDFDRLTSADTKGIVRVVTLNHWLNRYLQLAAYVEKNRVSLEKYKCRT